MEAIKLKLKLKCQNVNENTSRNIGYRTLEELIPYT